MGNLLHVSKEVLSLFWLVFDFSQPGFTQLVVRSTVLEGGGVANLS